MSHFDNYIDQCRKNYFSDHNNFLLRLKKQFTLKIPRPNWCTSSDNLYQFFQNQGKLISRGNIVWGHIVQANQLLFTPNDDHDCPASIVYCPEPNISVQFETLKTVAHTLYELKNTTPDDPEKAKIAAMLTSEVSRTFGLKIPDELSSGLKLRESSIMICRKHLPQGYLRRGLLPILVSPQEPYYAMTLPQKYWAKDFRENW
ncbi:hypothetical protein [Pleionea sp. CnH1-48]|uniref:hypothetical protein n=1 Tax=Pleionea sp. CnH1-48 TaxID=2954494 RepID=UPI0020985F58|nr:hypothetical protein [Pleionea sp. CnH1-48]MCO7224766.1 hypothetical protein [Pleionea sp. CnH1-48]